MKYAILLAILVVVTACTPGQTPEQIPNQTPPDTSDGQLDGIPSPLGEFVPDEIDVAKELLELEKQEGNLVGNAITVTGSPAKVVFVGCAENAQTGALAVTYQLYAGDQAVGSATTRTIADVCLGAETKNYYCKDSNGITGATGSYVECPEDCHQNTCNYFADYDEDGKFETDVDLAFFTTKLGQSADVCPKCDLNGNGQIDDEDYDMLLAFLLFEGDVFEADGEVKPNIPVAEEEPYEWVNPLPSCGGFAPQCNYLDMDFESAGEYEITFAANGLKQKANGAAYYSTLDTARKMQQCFGGTLVNWIPDLQGISKNIVEYRIISGASDVNFGSLTPDANGIPTILEGSPLGRDISMRSYEGTLQMYLPGPQANVLQKLQNVPGAAMSLISQAAAGCTMEVTDYPISTLRIIIAGREVESPATVSPGQPIEYSWTSFNGQTFTSSFSEDGGAPQAWIANDAKNSKRANVDCSQQGHTYTLNYDVTGSGVTARASKTIIVRNDAARCSAPNNPAAFQSASDCSTVAIGAKQCSAQTGKYEVCAMQFGIGQKWFAWNCGAGPDAAYCQQSCTGANAPPPPPPPPPQVPPPQGANVGAQCNDGSGTPVDGRCQSGQCDLWKGWGNCQTCASTQNCDTSCIQDSAVDGWGVWCTAGTTGTSSGDQCNDAATPNDARCPGSTCSVYQGWMNDGSTCACPGNDCSACDGYGIYCA